MWVPRPGALDISAEAEMERLRWALPIVVDEAEKWYDEHNGNGLKPLISVDTFRAAVAERCVTELGAGIINDISGGTLDEKMFDVVARTRPIYILMHSRGTPQDMQQRTDYADGVVDEVIRFFKGQVGKLVECARAELGAKSSKSSNGSKGLKTWSSILVSDLPRPWSRTMH